MVGGDWNLAPEVLASSNWPRIMQGTIHAPPSPTCNEKVYDYFLVSSDISHAVVGVKRLSDGGCKPHWSVRLYLHGAARAKAVRRLIKPDFVPGILPHGPTIKPPAPPEDGSKDGLRGWYSRARTVWHSLLATTPKVREHCFRWEPAAGRMARPDAGAPAASATLRAMARKLDDSIGLLKKGVRPTDPCVRANSANNIRACGKKELRSPDVKFTALRSWCTQADAALGSGNTPKAEQLLSTIKKKAKALEDEDSKKRQLLWRKALTRTSVQAKRDSGHGKQLSKLAFQWIRGITGWTRSSTGRATEEDIIPDADNSDKEPPKLDSADPLQEENAHPVHVPRSDQSEVNNAAKNWGKLWQSEAPYVLPDFAGIEDEHLESLFVEDLLRAAASFPTSTGLGVDNFSPRALLRLPLELLEELAEILNAAEEIGSWDEVLDLVLIVLLPKDDGGHMPIGLFPSVIRVWMRARSTVARQWEQDSAGPEYFGCKGMGAQRAAWCAAFEAETAASKGDDHAATLLDLVKAFEMVPHAMLVKAAKELGFSLKVLRMSLAAYRLIRTLGVDGV